MESLTAIIFLALMAGIPILMIGVLVYRGVRWAIVRARWKTTLEERGWKEPEGEAPARAALEDAGFSTKRAWLTWLAERDGAFVAHYLRKDHRRTEGQARRVLIVPRRVPGPSGALQSRVEGLLEGAALLVASALDVAPRDIEGWEWALVFPRGGAWLEPAASLPLRTFLRPGETLAFGETHVVLSLPDGEVPELFRRIDGLLAALNDVSDG